MKIRTGFVSNSSSSSFVVVRHNTLLSKEQLAKVNLEHVDYVDLDTYTEKNLEILCIGQLPHGDGNEHIDNAKTIMKLLTSLGHDTSNFQYIALED